MGEPAENVIDIDSEDEHRCEAEVPFTSRATRGSGGFRGFIPQFIPQFIMFIMFFQTKSAKSGNFPH